MGKIITASDIKNVSTNLQAEKNKVVLAGGCFDILHAGHIHFLTEAKKQGTSLFLLLESDDSIRLEKGSNRPIHSQKERALVLSALSMVDYILLLQPKMTHNDYDNLVNMLKPAIIATTKGDTKRAHKERQARLIGGTVVDVVKRLEEHATTRLAEALQKEL